MSPLPSLAVWRGFAAVFAIVAVVLIWGATPVGAQPILEATNEASAGAGVESAPSGPFDPEASAQKTLLEKKLPWFGPEGLKRMEPVRRREVDVESPSFASLLGWVFLIISLIGLGVGLYFLLQYLTLGSRPAPTVVSREPGRKVDRVEELPAGVSATGSTDFLAEARKLAAAGDFSRAVVYLYGWQLLELDRGHAVRLVKGKTNRQYLREAIQSCGPELGTLLQQTVDAFESVYFGGRRLTRELFDPLWDRIPEFQRLAVRRTA